MLDKISCKNIKPGMQVQPGIVQPHIPIYLGHRDLLFTFNSKSRTCLSEQYLKCGFMQNQQTLHASTT